MTGVLMIVAFIAGGMCGVLVMALAVIAADRDRRLANTSTTATLSPGPRAWSREADRVPTSTFHLYTSDGRLAVTVHGATEDQAIDRAAAIATGLRTTVGIWN